MIAFLREQVRKTYQSAIGRSGHDLVTPALILDLDAAERNIEFMTDKLRQFDAHFRPHIKGQKSPDLAKMQIVAGAIGAYTATEWEAIVISRAGMPVT